MIKNSHIGGYFRLTNVYILAIETPAVQSTHHKKIYNLNFLKNLTKKLKNTKK